MTENLDFDEWTDALHAALRAREGAAGLVLLGSTVAAHRRDEWSDHDFFALAAPGRGAELRAVEEWLPFPERCVLVAREGEIGFAAVYDDGHVAEFAAATADELAGALVTGDSAIAFDDGPAAGLVAAARARVEAVTIDPVNEARLVLVKLLIGVGRARRGERLAAGHFVRSWALECFVRVVRARIPVADSVRDAIDPVRRFERDYPELAAQLDEVLAAPVEEAGRGLFELFRETLDVPGRIVGDAVVGRRPSF
ncbi:hypothetical protein [uncultured Schumannella sp.]|uniref:hypothetical protein n=1 Tax=uncultured Schumannella sp. TaxID=1195956 RepID=UPI0025DAEE22|nr:hypothetical protein [uncultured Schumannella sp.]